VWSQSYEGKKKKDPDILPEWRTVEKGCLVPPNREGRKGGGGRGRKIYGKHQRKRGVQRSGADLRFVTSRLVRGEERNND